MPCVTCAAMAAENARLREEVAAWRANDDEARDGQVFLARLDRWRSVFPELAYRHLMVLLTLVDRCGRIASNELLADATARSPLAYREDPHASAVAVAICQTRRVLRALAAEGVLPKACQSVEAGIRTHRGLGYSIDVAAAGVLRRLAGEGADV